MLMLMSKYEFYFNYREWYYGRKVFVNGLRDFVWRFSPTPSGDITRGITMKKYEPWSEEINLFFLKLEVFYSLDYF